MFINYLICSILAILSLVLCAIAIAILIRYRLYFAFNYRLVLYLLIPSIIIAITRFSNNLTSTIIPITLAGPWSCNVISSVEVYGVWSLQLLTTFFAVELFFMVVFSTELRKAEVIVVVACFSLPVAPAIFPLILSTNFGFSCENTGDSNSTTLIRNSNTTQFFQYNDILGMVITGTCFVAIATVMSCLAYRGLRKHLIGKHNEEQDLLYEQIGRRYQTALKEILPFTIYPVSIQFSHLMFYVYIHVCSIVVTCLYLLIFASFGAIVSTIFFIHIKILGRQRRNKYRNRPHGPGHRSTFRRINEGESITAAGSITATHVTDFTPITESDMDANS